MVGAPKVVCMSHDQVTDLVRSHWGMVDCLFDEIFLDKHEDTLHEKEVLEELFRYFASHDPRFHAAGLCWNQRGYVEYRAGGTCYKAEGAIAAFLGLPVNRFGDATGNALNVIYRQFASLLEARIWLRWHVQKMYGFDRKERDLWTGYPREFPVVTEENQ